MDINEFTKDEAKYAKSYNQKSFLQKITKYGKNLGAKGVYYALLLYYVLMDSNTSMADRMTIIGALGYFILPLDIIPDVIPIVGFGDDLAVLTYAVKKVYDNITPAVKDKAKCQLRDWFGEVSADDLKID